MELSQLTYYMHIWSCSELHL